MTTQESSFSQSIIRHIPGGGAKFGGGPEMPGGAIPKKCKKYTHYYIYAYPRHSKIFWTVYIRTKRKDGTIFRVCFLFQCLFPKSSDLTESSTVIPYKCSEQYEKFHSQYC